MRILRVLLRGGPPMTGRALARVTGLSQSSAQRALSRLREAGLVLADPAPPSLLYRPNPEHLAMPALLGLLRQEEELRASLVGHVASWHPQPESVVVFGSVARGEATARSDVDVLAVRSDAIAPDETTWESQLAGLSGRILRWTGRRASVIEMSVQEVREGLRAREPFLVEADRDGWLIAGRALRDIAGSSL